jgi:hypothetical protein
MRWLYPDPSSKREANQRKALVAAIDKWWKTFEGAATKIDAMYTSGTEFDIVRFMDTHLARIDKEIFWEFGPALKKDGHRLNFSPESRHNLEPIVQTLLARAPKLQRWEFYLYRIAEDLAQVARNVYSRSGGNLEGARAKLTVGRGNLIDVQFHFPDPSGDSKDARLAAQIATEYLVGEQAYHFWVGYIDVAEKAQGRGWMSLEKFKSTFEALVGSIRDQLPPKPIHAWSSKVRWFTYEREVAEAEDYGGVSDIFTGTITLTAALAAMFDGRGFATERFTRHNEVHAFLKVDFEEVEFSDYVKERGKIQDAIEHALRAKKLGGIWGTGAGKRYAYLFLGLTDVHEAVEVVRKSLKTTSISRRAWVQFFDVRLRDEWLGVFSGTPAPPTEPRA